jgi:hypothetical protein
MRSIPVTHGAQSFVLIRRSKGVWGLNRKIRKM